MGTSPGSKHLLSDLSKALLFLVLTGLVAFVGVPILMILPFVKDSGELSCAPNWEVLSEYNNKKRSDRD